MTGDMTDGTKQCIFTWFIENYSYCWHKNGEPLVSPGFTADGLDGTIWYMELFPRGIDDERIGDIFISLRRIYFDDGPERFPVTYTLSFLQSDGTDLQSMTSTYVFPKGTREGFTFFLQRDVALSIDNEKYLPQDTLTLRCRINVGTGNIEKVTHIFARTRIAIEQISFLQTVESFSTIEPNQKKIIHIKSPSKKAFSLSSGLYFTDGPCCEGKIIMEITPLGANQILSSCKISLIDGSGKFIECGAADNRFDDARKDITKIPLCLTKQAVLDKKSEYLPDDKLILRCKCIFSTGLEYEIIESTLGETDLNQVSKNEQNKDVYNTTAKLFAGPSATDDLKAVYNDQLLTDVELKTKTK
ncbi:uncharacterized protein LOC129976430 [Argiope bruennichi]|uniref:uncharacterized protein LOC129976430 n=1 Tax=Argiope bruennichi TaxID=94029 RepID=UPI002493F877|nr:uncharacterized protein LOC129976430 [Argiope bruennichi]